MRTANKKKLKDDKNGHWDERAFRSISAFSNLPFVIYGLYTLDQISVYNIFEKNKSTS